MNVYSSILLHVVSVDIDLMNLYVNFFRVGLAGKKEME